MTLCIVTYGMEIPPLNGKSYPKYFGGGNFPPRFWDQVLPLVVTDQNYHVSCTNMPPCRKWEWLSCTFLTQQNRSHLTVPTLKFKPYLHCSLCVLIKKSTVMVRVFVVYKLINQYCTTACQNKPNFEQSLSQCYQLPFHLPFFFFQVLGYSQLPVFIPSLSHSVRTFLGLLEECLLVIGKDINCWHFCLLN